MERLRRVRRPPLRRSREGTALRLRLGFAPGRRKRLPSRACFVLLGEDWIRSTVMRRLTLLIAAAALAVAAWLHFPAAPQRAAQPAASEAITFGQYRDFRLHDLAQRQARLTKQLAAPDLSAAERGNLERRKAYFDQLTAMPAEERDQLERFD